MMSTLYDVHDPMCSWCRTFRPARDWLRRRLPADVAMRRMLVDDIRVPRRLGGRGFPGLVLEADSMFLHLRVDYNDADAILGQISPIGKCCGAANKRETSTS